MKTQMHIGERKKKKHEDKNAHWRKKDKETYRQKRTLEKER